MAYIDKVIKNKITMIMMKSDCVLIKNNKKNEVINYNFHNDKFSDYIQGYMLYK